MEDFKSTTDLKNVAFISTRIAGTDGVSLEIEKWADIFEQEGFTCYYFAGELDRPAIRVEIKATFFKSVVDVKSSIFGSFTFHKFRIGLDSAGAAQDLLIFELDHFN